MRFAPVLRKDVVYVDVFSEKDSVIEFLTGPEILRSFFHEKCVYALVGG